ncbi:L-serine ammonia-lyase [Rhodospirillaceae bacterium SYSU D60014]|uniref:L-serine ammonia-lyase n=1 Tax=Virgifigura deserti TaxID=2268457 RepID=UPI000E6740D0
MFLSVLDIFKIGIGPSSSHTMGPMVAAERFLTDLATLDGPPARIRVSLHGSLAFTGKGHASDQAVMLGLCGETPDRIDPDAAPAILAELAEKKRLLAPGHEEVAFDPEADLVFDYGPPLPGHANGMIFQALDENGACLLRRVYYSIGGGFVADEGELSNLTAGPARSDPVPYPFASAREMLEMGRQSGLSIAEMKRANEQARHPGLDLDAALDHIWDAMSRCMERGLGQAGTLPGGLSVKRRASSIYEKLRSEQGQNALQPHRLMDWLSVYAMAVNEENAAGGRIVTAPTNGAAGVVPAVIRYYLDHCIGAGPAGLRTFLLVAAAIGGIIKCNASISGAEVGCQGEVGSASAMAAAGLAAALGATNEQVENAAEIALEHHLGMTCDPIGGLVQVPCIERNALGAIKAVTASSLALRGDGKHFVALDHCIETMRQTGLDMNEKYKETSTGGLAVNAPAC